VFSLIAVTVPAQETPDQSAVLRNGLVFMDGRFVPGPYLLERSEQERAVEVVVAGIPLDRFSVREPVDAVTAGGAIPLPEYEMPEGVDTLRESGYPLYLHRLLKYHAAQVGYAGALTLVEQEASSSPLVDRLERHEDGLLLFDKHADPYFVGAGTDLELPGLARGEALALADRTLRAYRDILSQGGAILHFHAADIFLPRVRVEDLLIPSLEILDDPAWPSEEKRRRLYELWKNNGIVEQILTGYRPVPELRVALQPYKDGR
jgi:hypothetical protein